MQVYWGKYGISKGGWCLTYGKIFTIVYKYVRNLEAVVCILDTSIYKYVQ
jgi:hypothetical protein